MFSGVSGYVMRDRAFLNPIVRQGHARGFSSSVRIYQPEVLKDLTSHSFRPIEDRSYGIIPLKRNEEGKWMVLLIHQAEGHWGLPKGHAEKGELPLEASRRELLEETGLQIKECLTDEMLKKEYSFYKGNQEIRKTAYFAMALVSGKISLQKEEVQNSCWVPLLKAEEYLSFEESKDLIRKCIRKLYSPESE